MNTAADTREAATNESVAPIFTERMPDWPRITFEIPCPVCGANLWGQSAPSCTECGLDSSWERLLPLDQIRCPKCRYQLLGLSEPRCPECGVKFDWILRLKKARQQHSRLFEFLWYDNPAPAFVRSARLAVFAPGKLWREYVGHRDAAVLPLLGLILVQCIIFAKGWQVTAWAVDPLINGVADWRGDGLRFIYPFRLRGDYLFMAAVWHLVTFMALQLLFQTKRRLGVRWVDLLRVYAHATIFIAFCPAAWCVLEGLLDSTLFFTRSIIGGGRYDRGYLVLAQCVFGAGLTLTWIYLTFGLRRHLKIPHAWAVSGAALLIGFLWGFRAISSPL